jgi:hypothetical protein
MSTCEHRWIKVHEQFLLGGSFPVGWQCEKCNKYVPLADITPEGLPGVMTKRHKLVGAHGGAVATGSGKPCKSQIWDEETGKLEYLK